MVLDSDWEAEFCRVAEAHPRVRAYVKNAGLGFEVPYRFGSVQRMYRPDFIVLVDDGRGTRGASAGDSAGDSARDSARDSDLLHLVVEIKGYRREDAKDKKIAMETYWIPGVNHLGAHGRWAFAEFTEVYRIEADFAAKINVQFETMIQGTTTTSEKN
ncbi:MAG: hypothetical protein NVSMB1_22160 [Polyangiales bacterium]